MELLKCDNCSEIAEFQPTQFGGAKTPKGWCKARWSVLANNAHQGGAILATSSKFDVCPGCAPTVVHLLSQVVSQEEKKDGQE